MYPTYCVCAVNICASVQYAMQLPKVINRLLVSVTVALVSTEAIAESLAVIKLLEKFKFIICIV